MWMLNLSSIQEWIDKGELCPVKKWRITHCTCYKAIVTVACITCTGEESIVRLVGLLVFQGGKIPVQSSEKYSFVKL